MPCDSPFLPADLVSRLKQPGRRTDLAVAKTGDQPHPVFALMKREVRESLEAFLASGGRKIDAWYAALKVVEVPFDDEADAFRNINTLDELEGANEHRSRPSAASTATTRTRCAVDKAREAILACLSPSRRPRRSTCAKASGRVLAEDIVPAINVPAHDNSAMDGYAVRFAI